MSSSRRQALALVLLLIGLGALPTSVLAGSFTVTVSGRWLCQNLDRVVPVPRARVEIYDSDSGLGNWIDQKIGHGYTDADGRFSIEANGGDDFFGERPDVYAKLVLDDDGVAGFGAVRVIDELRNRSAYDTSPVAEAPDVLDIGTWLIPSPGPETSVECGVWIAHHAVYQEYVALMNAAPPAGQLNVEYFWAGFPAPWASVDSIKWPHHHPTAFGNPPDPTDPYATPRHEFAHTVRHAFDGNANHWLNDVAAYSYAQPHAYCDVKNKGFAFNEGWANFWAGWWPARRYHCPNIQLGGCPDAGDLRCEGNVTDKLLHLERRLFQPGCRLLGREGMVAVLAQNPGTIHDYWEFERAFEKLYPECPELLPLPAPGPPAGPAPSNFAVPMERQIALTQAEIDAQSARIETLAAELVQAELDLERLVPCSPVPCPRDWELIARPAGLEAQIELARLVQWRLGKSIEAASARVEKRLARPAHYLRLAVLKRRVLSSQHRIQIRALRKLIHTARPFRLRDTSGVFAALTTEMRERLREAEELFLSGAEPPLSASPRYETRATALPAGKPDLTASVQALGGAEGPGCFVRYRLANLGGADAGASTTLVVVTGPFGPFETAVASQPLGVGESRGELAFIPYCTVSNVTVRADAADDIDELIETNNVATLAFP